MNLHTLSILLGELSRQLWPWKPLHCVHVIASGPVSLCGTPPPWLKWKFSCFLFSTGTVLGLYYLVNLRLGSLLQAESDDGLLDQIRKWFGKWFCMLQYKSCFLLDSVIYLSFSCYLSFQLSRPEEGEKREMLLLMMQYLHLFDRLWSSSSGSPTHSTGARTASARTLRGSCLHS